MPPWLLLFAFLQLGACSGSSLINSPPAGLQLATQAPFYADLGLKAQASWLFLEGSVRTDMSMGRLDAWWPFESSYSIGAGLDFGFLKLGWKHTCYHPVAPYMRYAGYAMVPSSEGAVDDFYMRLELKARP